MPHLVGIRHPLTLLTLTAAAIFRLAIAVLIALERCWSQEAGTIE